MRRFRLLTMLMLPVLVALMSTQVAYASPPSDKGPFPLTSVPLCVAGEPDTGGAHICLVAMFSGLINQASTGEWIVVRGGDREDTLAHCLSWQTGVAATYTLNGRTVPTDTTPCAYFAEGGYWVVDWRMLSHPLPPGVYTLTETFVAIADLYDGTPKGTTIFVATDTLTVVQHG